MLPPDHRRESLLRSLRKNLGLLFGLAAIAWGLELIDAVLPGSWDRFGIRPRSLAGLLGIAFSPFLHLGFSHLVSNTLPFLMLGGIVLIGGRRIFALATLSILALGGAALWMLGPPHTNHVGASLLIFGYLGFLLSRGVIERSVFWIVVAVVVLAVYGGMMSGVLPGVKGVSWQGHLCGFLAGVVAAKMLFSRSTPPGGTRGDLRG
ncbi:MAG TPA: rhomboid family intramembrane serine protease [Bacteroidia bacterium]|nr:rhomboid family intramembrane serine protease [Bacteroidia bacterium]